MRLNWTTDCFEIVFVEWWKVAIVISGLNWIFFKVQDVPDFRSVDHRCICVSQYQTS